MNLIVEFLLQVVRMMSGAVVVYGILGYDLSCYANKTAATIIGIVNILLPVFGLNEKVELVISSLLIFTMICSILGKVKIGAFVAYVLITHSFIELCTGIMMFMGFQIKGDFEHQMSILIGNVMVLAIYIVGTVIAWKYRRTIRTCIEQITNAGYIIICAVMCVPLYSCMTSDMINAGYPNVEGLLTVTDGIIGAMLAVLIVTIVVLAFKSKELSREIYLNRRCMEEQTRQYRLLSQKQMKVRKLRHDNRAHLMAIRKLAEQDGAQHVLDYIAEVVSADEETRHFDTGNVIADAVVNQYYGLGLKDGVQVDVIGTFGKQLSISDSELCVIMTNAVSNAYDAAVQCKVSSFVDVEISSFKSKQFICIKNTSVNEPPIRDQRMVFGQTTKKDKELHGYGLQNLYDTVMKNGGSVQWSCEKRGKNYVVTTDICLERNFN